MSKRKNVIILIIAILCGLIGVYAVMNYVGSVTTVYNEKPMGEVVAAVQNIPQNVRITREMIQIVSVEPEYILPDTFLKVEDVIGAMTTTNIYKSEQILKGRISRGGTPSDFSYGIPDGKRAVSLALDQVKGVSGLIRPGDRIDILGTLEVPDDNSGSVEGVGSATDGEKTVNVSVKVSWAEELKVFQKIAQKLLEGRRIVSLDGKNFTFTMFQNIEVLAVGNRVTSAGERESIIKENSGEKEAKTITLCLDPEQVELITNLEKVGSIKFELRNPGDDRIVDMKPIVEYKPK